MRHLLKELVWKQAEVLIILHLLFNAGVMLSIYHIRKIMGWDKPEEIRVVIRELK